MTSPLVQKLTGVRDLKRILETTVRELGETFNAEACQVMLSNPLDPNVTSICEYRPAPDAADGFNCITMPLVLQGRTFGSVSVSRDTVLSPDELNAMRVLLGELGDIIRLAQINDVVQRDTFRETFLVEIGNVMSYSMGIGDALFLVVNILGKALSASRCLFICTDETQAGWRCYEFWQQDKVKSCQEFYWPATDSPLVAQVLLSRTPLKVFEGQENSYVSPVQEELQFIGAKSLLGVALRTEKGTHGCVILQQCDYRRAWTRSETDMVQNVADKVADALLKLPAEKLAREPIMRLHQRIVTAEPDDAVSDVQLRRALKASLGAQAIPSARKTGAPPIPAAAKTAEPAAKPAPAAAPAQAAAAASTAGAATGAAGGGAAAAQTAAQTATTAVGAQSTLAQPPVSPAQSGAAAAAATAQSASAQATTASLHVVEVESFAPAEDVPKPTIKPVTRPSMTAITAPPYQPAVKPETPTSGDVQSFAPGDSKLRLDGKAAPPPEADPYASLDDEFGEPPDVVAEPSHAAAAKSDTSRTSTGSEDSPFRGPTAERAKAEQAEPVQGKGPEEAPQARATTEPTAAGAEPADATAGIEAKAEKKAEARTGTDSGVEPEKQAEEKTGAEAKKKVGAEEKAASTVEPADTAEPAGKWGNLDSIPTPKSDVGPAPSTNWGDLDSIPTPAGAPKDGGGLRGSMLGKAKATSAASPLMSSFRKGRGAPEPAQAEAPAEFDDEAAKKKLDQILASPTNETSDYIFATPGLDARLLGRIDGWVSQIEQKDKYKNGHARQVAQYAVAIAEELGMKKDDTVTTRQAALVHDLGKLGIAQQILQKAEDALEDDQFVLKMGHAVAGAQLLESFPDLKHLAPLVITHHEEYDGEGFPQGLKGDEIPVAGRILAVANAYHELVSVKVYGAGMKPEDAQKQMVEAAGSQYDPTVVEALIQAIKSGRVPPAC